MLPEANPAPRSIGRYLLFGEIASGGMATVHFGRLSGPAGFARTVAIKRLHPNYAKDPEFVAMFLDEARLAARVRHPNVVPTLDVVATEGEIFLVMEYVQGESLAKLVRGLRATSKSADPRIVATIVSSVLHGLHAAHEAKSEQGEPLNIVHRDVSPQNVLVGSDGVPRVLDFGVAKAVGRLQTTREGTIKGKLAYMPPEQLHGAALTRQADVYAASVCAWELLTGQRLFRGETEAALVTAILQAPLRAPSEVDARVPAAFDRVVMRGLERNVAHRYATAREMAIDLEKCVGVASASEVGEWVESLARDELHKRTERIAEIESVSSSGMAPEVLRSELPTVTSASSVAPTIASTDGSEAKSEVSSVAVGPVGPTIPVPARRRPRLALAAVVGVATVAAIAGVVAMRRGTREPRAAASAAASAPAASDTVSSDPVPASAPTPTAITISSAPAPSATPKVQRPHAAAVATVSTTSTSPAKPAADCDPPFTIDDKGHKHYKPACFR